MDKNIKTAKNSAIKIKISKGSCRPPYWSFQIRKNYFCMLNIERPRVHQILITFLFIHPVYA